MGRKLDVLLGRTTKQTARLKSLLGLAAKRIAVVRGHRQVRHAQARGDVEQLLRLGHPDRALLRAEQVVREADALDALAMLESYCNLVADRAALVDAHHDCPEELREAAAGLVYAAARFGDLPELQEVRALLAGKFGRGFVSAAAELRSGCGVDMKIVQNSRSCPRSSPGWRGGRRCSWRSAPRRRSPCAFTAPRTRSPSIPATAARTTRGGARRREPTTPRETTSSLPAPCWHSKTSKRRRRPRSNRRPRQRLPPRLPSSSRELAQGAPTTGTGGRREMRTTTTRCYTVPSIWPGADRFQSGQIEDFSSSARAIWH